MAMISKLKAFATFISCKLINNVHEVCPKHHFPRWEALTQLGVCPSWCCAACFFISAIFLKDLSPEQFETMRHMYMRSAIATFGKAPWRSSLYSKTAREAGVLQPRDFAKWTNWTISSQHILGFKSVEYMFQPKFVCVAEVDHYQAHEIQRSL